MGGVIFAINPIIKGSSLNIKKPGGGWILVNIYNSIKIALNQKAVEYLPLIYPVYPWYMVPSCAHRAVNRPCIKKIEGGGHFVQIAKNGDKINLLFVQTIKIQFLVPNYFP